MTQYDNALDIGWALKAYYYFRNNLFTVMYDRFCLALAAAREIGWGINGLDNLPNHLGKRRVGREIA